MMHWGIKKTPIPCSQSVVKTLLTYKTCLYIFGGNACIFNRRVENSQINLLNALMQSVYITGLVFMYTSSCSHFRTMVCFSFMRSASKIDLSLH